MSDMKIVKFLCPNYDGKNYTFMQLVHLKDGLLVNQTMNNVNIILTHFNRGT